MNVNLSTTTPKVRDVPKQNRTNWRQRCYQGP